MSEFGRTTKDRTELSLPSFGIVLDSASDREKMSDAQVAALRMLDQMIVAADKVPVSKGGADSIRLAAVGGGRIIS